MGNLILLLVLLLYCIIYLLQNPRRTNIYMSDMFYTTVYLILKCILNKTTICNNLDLFFEILKQYFWIGSS